MMPMPCGYHYLQKTALPRIALAAKKLKFQNADLSIYTLLYIVHVSTNPLLLTMTLWEVTITDNCCHWKKTRKKMGSYD